jgi:hypothetical protein
MWFYDPFPAVVMEKPKSVVCLFSVETTEGNRGGKDGTIRPLSHQEI